MTMAAGGWRTAFAMQDGVLQVALTDESLAGCMAALRRRIRDHMVDGGELVIVDIRSLSTMSATTLAALLTARRHCKSLGGELVVHAAGDGLAPARFARLYDLLNVEHERQGRRAL